MTVYGQRRRIYISLFREVAEECLLSVMRLCHSVRMAGVAERHLDLRVRPSFTLNPIWNGHLVSTLIPVCPFCVMQSLCISFFLLCCISISLLLPLPVE